jgi:dipeptidase D
MSKESEGLVETSNNLAEVSILPVKAGAGAGYSVLRIATSQRSSVASQLTFINQKIEAIAKLAGATATETDSYPGWEPDWNADLLKKSVAAYEKAFKKKPVVEVIHAGLECGVISEKYPNMQMLSIGPTVVSPHTPNERLKLADIDKLVTLILGIFKEL